MSYEHNCQACDYHTNVTSLFTRHCETIKHKRIQKGEKEYRCNDKKYITTKHGKNVIMTNI